MIPSSTRLMLIAVVALPYYSVHSLLSKANNNHAHNGISLHSRNNIISPQPRISISKLHSSKAKSLGSDIISTDDDQHTQQIIIQEHNRQNNTTHLHRLLTSYTLHWENLLLREYQETYRELHKRRKSYTRSQLEASGLAIFNAVASPETELLGEKIVRISLQQLSNKLSKYDNNKDVVKLREKFKRGDALLLSPQISFRGKDIAPKEGLVMDVGNDYLTLGIGPSWPLGLMEMRKHYEGYTVRLDRSISNIPLKAQRMALDKLRKGKAGNVADLLVQLYYNEPCALNVAKEIPSHFDNDIENRIDEQLASAIKEAMADITFKPNPSQQDAIIWALSRTIGLIRGPPGTGKTRVAALLISTALKMKLKQQQKEDSEDNDNIVDVARSPRVLAVTHSNGAADVLLQVLLQMNVPAVRAGRPASVSPSVQHRTIAALSEKIPAVVELRRQAGDVSLDSETRQSAIYEAKKYMNDAQSVIARSAQVVVASCIGAQQLLTTVGGDKEDESVFDIVVLDEAAQTTEPALICALAASNACQLVLVGDTMQLPPTVTTQDVELRKTIGISPMERLLKNGIDEFVLKEQYRMPQALLHHPNTYFYGSVVKCATTGANLSVSPPRGFPWPSPTNEPLAFIEVGRDSEISHNFGGRSNPTEVSVIVDIIGRVLQAGDVHAENIAIITPYSKQVQLFRTELSSAARNIGSKISDVKVGTVDSYQGQETDLVIFSGVRSNLMKELGFLRDSRRLNVAITRAKRGLIVVGDPTVLRTCKHWSALLDSCSDRGCTMTQREYMQAAPLDATPGDERKRRLSSLELDMDDEFFGLFSDED